MRTLLIAVLLVGCGKVNKAPDDGGPVSDADDIDAPVDGPPAVTCANPVNGRSIRFREIGAVLGAAVLVTAPTNDSRLFVLEQAGRIRIFDNEALLPTPFIDLSDVLVAGGERGLLGLAVHPQYAANGQFFVYYTTGNANVVARCARSANDPNVAEESCVTVLSIPDFASNHNGGMIEFGNDGLLYIGTGDGGSGNDPNRNGQSLVDGSPLPASVALLGKMLRIDVDNKMPGREYGIPAGNPFAAGGGAPEIFQIGLRNPWRWSFDRANGDMWIGDVGQGAIEELTMVSAAEAPGKNFGWRIYEGTVCTQLDGACSPTNMTFPQDERPRNEGWASIIGGQVYRGTCYPDIVGTYFYADHIASQNNYRTATKSGATVTTSVLTAPNGVTYPRQPTSLHADGRGELWLTTLGGRVLRLEAGP
jgi:glucose/arabinose dehydrogenase